MLWFARSLNVAPQSVQPVVRVNRDAGNRQFALMRWGFGASVGEGRQNRLNTINAVAEEVASKPGFREAFKSGTA